MTEPSTPESENSAFCTYDDFAKIKLKVAEIIEAKPHPNADKLLVLQLKVGDRQKQICAGIKAYYSPEQLIGRRIIIVDNLEPRKLRGEISEGMLLASHDFGGENGTERVSLLTIDAADFTAGSAVG